MTMQSSRNPLRNTARHKITGQPQPVQVRDRLWLSCYFTRAKRVAPLSNF